jgi:uncharacterized membrane protein SpoIIM required for sporulation
MKETRFIIQNKEKWQEAETLLDSTHKDPEKLSNLFVQVTDDLSYARTYYGNRSVRVYLNTIARNFFAIIYSQKNERHGGFRLFWLDELPQLIIHARREILISFIVFSLAMVIGIFSSIHDPQFTGTILGNDYVAMTEKNIAQGDPMAVYKHSHQLDMFLGITLNNLMVAFRTYALGILLCIGTLGSLISNGVMVGCFQYYFLQRGLLIESASSIWLHGTLEISSIILAGGAGLTLGRGLIFPGTYSRLQSLQISGARSLKLMLGITPVFIIAAVIESFLTRYTDAPLALKISLIVMSLTFIVGYFVVYPWLKSKSGFLVPITETRLQPSPVRKIDFGRIKNNSEILRDTFQFYSRHSSRILQIVFSVAAVNSVFLLFLTEESFAYDRTLWFRNFLQDMFFALQTPNLIITAVNSVSFAVILYYVLRWMDVESTGDRFTVDWKWLFQVEIITAAIFAGIYLDFLGILFVIASFGLLFFSAFAMIAGKVSLTRGLSEGWSLFGQNNNQGIGLQAIVLLLSLSFMVVLAAPLYYINMNIIQWNFATSDAWSNYFIRFLGLFIKISAFYLTLPVIASSMSLLYFSQREALTATHLKKSIANLGNQQRARQ